MSFAFSVPRIINPVNSPHCESLLVLGSHKYLFILALHLLAMK